MGSSSQKKKFDPEKFDPSPYTDTAMRQFWKDHMDHFVNKLIEHTYAIPEINERFEKLVKEVNRRYGRLTIARITTYFPESHSILGGAGLSKDGSAELSLIMPAIMDAYYRMQASGHTHLEKLFEHMVIIGIMHELDHIAHEKILGTRSNPPPLSVLLDKETKAWALTCEYTIRPLVERHGVPLTPSDFNYYNTWLRADRNVESSVWKEFIRNTYIDTALKRN